MRVSVLLLTILALALVWALSTAPMDPHHPDVRPFVGTWHGQAGTRVIDLTIESDGTFRWMGTAGQARGEGDGRIGSLGADTRIDLPFIDSQPLRLEVTGEGKCLTLTGQSGKEFVLSRE